MPFIERKPIFPTGFIVGDLPPVRVPLYVSESTEVYLLEETSRSNLILLLLRQGADRSLGGC